MRRWGHTAPADRVGVIRQQRRCSAFVLVLLLACAPTRSIAATVDDPLEPLNRGIFEFNRIVDGLVLEPATQVYTVAVPAPARDSVSNFLANLRSPVVFVNHLLQGEREYAGVTLGRFMINSTMGIFGLFDFASVVGMAPREDADFGQTLGVWGVGAGAYLVLPLFGPSTIRDASGLVVDSFVFDPFPYVADEEVRLARLGATAIDTRYRYGPLIDDLEASSLDFYVAVRTAFLQNRDSRIRKGEQVVDEDYESIFEEDFDDDLIPE